MITEDCCALTERFICTCIVNVGVYLCISVSVAILICSPEFQVASLSFGALFVCLFVCFVTVPSLSRLTLSVLFADRRSAICV